MFPPRDFVLANIATAAFLASIDVGAGQTVQTGFVIRNVSLFDGERIRPQTNVVVENGLIRAIDRQMPNQWRSLPVIEGAGATLLPGLIDAHTHTTAVSQLQDALRFGVTTVLDMGTPMAERELREAAATRTDVADFRSAGVLATVPGGHGTQYGIPIPTVSGPADAEAFVNARKSEGADYLKIVLNGVRAARNGMPNMDAETARALVQAGHVHRMLVVAHIENLDDVRIAIASGVDGLAHTWREGGAAVDVARLVAKHHVFVIPTLAGPEGFVPGSGRALAADPRLEPFLTVPMVRRLTGETASSIPAQVRANIDVELASVRSSVRSLVAAGAMLVAGTDPPNGTVVHGASLHRELELLVRAGLNPVQALSAATRNTAEVFRLRDRGRIGVGARADMLLVRGDPSKDITATRDILKIWRAGAEFNRTVFRP